MRVLSQRKSPFHLIFEESSSAKSKNALHSLIKLVFPKQLLEPRLVTPYIFPFGNFECHCPQIAQPDGEQ